MTATARVRAFVTEHPALAALVGVAAVAVAALVVVLVTGDDDPPGSATDDVTVAPLTGLTGDFDGRLERPALFVKIDNVEQARPQVGLAEADIVFEEQVEGDLTRLAAVFHSTDAPEIGPVRSLRTTDIELVTLFGRPLVASSGGNDSVMGQIRDTDVVEIGHPVAGEAYERADDRSAPHNLMTSTAALYDVAPESPPPPAPLFSYLAEGDPLPDEATPVEGVTVRFGGAEVARFTWDADDGTWARDQRGSPDVDADGRQLAPTNVVVAEIDYDTSGDLGRSVPHGLVTGQGRAVVLTQGHAIEGTWSRATLADPLQLVGVDGEAIALTPGQTFVELPAPGGWDLL
jgi:hypothetical protein